MKSILFLILAAAPAVAADYKDKVRKDQLPLPPHEASPFPTVETIKSCDDVSAADLGLGWRKNPANPVLGGKDYGTIFDVSVVPIEGEYWMYVSWRPRKSIALSKSKDGVNWSEPEIVLGPADTGWEDQVNRPGVLHKDGVFHMSEDDRE
jgi:hypothetical protein